MILHDSIFSFLSIFLSLSTRERYKKNSAHSISHFRYTNNNSKKKRVKQNLKEQKISPHFAYLFNCAIYFFFVSKSKAKKNLAESYCLCAASLAFSNYRAMCMYKEQFIDYFISCFELAPFPFSQNNLLLFIFNCSKCPMQKSRTNCGYVCR